MRSPPPLFAKGVANSDDKLADLHAIRVCQGQWFDTIRQLIDLENGQVAIGVRPDQFGISLLSLSTPFIH